MSDMANTAEAFDVSLAIDHGARPGTTKDIEFNVIGSDGGEYA